MEINDYFLDKMDFVIGKWPDQVSWSVTQFASYMTYESDLVAECLSRALSRKVGVDDRIDRDEASQALIVLRSGKQLTRETVEKKNEESLDRVRKKTDQYCKSGEWGRAYQTLSYYVGQNLSILKFSEKAVLIGECLRLGTKSERTPQEMYTWLNHFIPTGPVSAQDPLMLPELLDLVDAYGAWFCKNENGRKLMLTLLQTVSPYAVSLDLGSELERLKGEIIR